MKKGVLAQVHEMATFSLIHAEVDSEKPSELLVKVLDQHLVSWYLGLTCESANMRGNHLWILLTLSLESWVICQDLVVGHAKNLVQVVSFDVELNELIERVTMISASKFWLGLTMCLKMVFKADSSAFSRRRWKHSVISFVLWLRPNSCSPASFPKVEWPDCW